MSFEHCPAVIAVLVMQGCPACDDYKPRLRREIKAWQGKGWPFVIATSGKQEVSRQQIPILFIDAATQDAQIQSDADQLGVQGVPATILYRRYQVPVRFDGPLADEQIYELLQLAASA